MSFINHVVDFNFVVLLLKLEQYIGNITKDSIEIRYVGNDLKYTYLV